MGMTSRSATRADELSGAELDCCVLDRKTEVSFENLDLEAAAGVCLFLGFNSHWQQRESVDLTGGSLFCAGGNQLAGWQ